MTDSPIPAGRAVGWAAYALSSLSALLWVAAVLPAGRLVNAADRSDLGTPIHREALLLVPALLLLLLLPVGMTLARRLQGAQTVLAATDAFVAIYAAIVLWKLGGPRDVARPVFTVLLAALGAISLLEVRRCIRSPARPLAWPLLRGLRLAICVVVLMTPTRFLLQEAKERASLLAPFGLIALGAAGSLLARRTETLRAVSALAQLALALHVYVTVRYTLEDRAPPIAHVGPAGRIALMLAAALVVVAAIQALLLLLAWRRSPQETIAAGDLA